MTLTRNTAMQLALDSLQKENEGLRGKLAEAEKWLDALVFISEQGCGRYDDLFCKDTGDCVTEWCLSCYAEAHAAREGEGVDGD